MVVAELSSFCVKKREEIVRRLLILVVYGGACIKSPLQTHYLFDAIIEGKDGFKPYVVILVLSLPWTHSQGN